ncbi:Probable RNA-directed DNA polymerase from transposon BS [Eumeta japonica]|uniref:Probable RNA-directed DNA polymerase from transposon BS n=1 Tax=Eumeta variegata TaxID=151549 RepID=A0A4C1UXN8_EUMVA|nr:Probable RNA-directed DNA polymerase from transposon BS [Eumeta japonica]
MLDRKRKLSRRNKRIIYKMCIRTVMTYASPAFAHAAPKVLGRLQVIQNKFCRSATNAHWCIRNSILHRDLELSAIAKFIWTHPNDSSISRGLVPMRSFVQQLTTNHHIPAILFVDHGMYLMIHLTLLQRQ